MNPDFSTALFDYYFTELSVRELKKNENLKVVVHYEHWGLLLIFIALTATLKFAERYEFFTYLCIAVTAAAICLWLVRKVFKKLPAYIEVNGIALKDYKKEALKQKLIDWHRPKAQYVDAISKIEQLSIIKNPDFQLFYSAVAIFAALLCVHISNEHIYWQIFFLAIFLVIVWLSKTFAVHFNIIIRHKKAAQYQILAKTLSEINYNNVKVTRVPLRPCLRRYKLH